MNRRITYLAAGLKCPHRTVATLARAWGTGGTAHALASVATRHFKPSTAYLTMIVFVSAVVLIGCTGVSQDYATDTADNAADGDVEQKEASPRPRFADTPTSRLQPSMSAAGTKAGELRTFNRELSLALAWCPSGQFTMGSPLGENGHDDDNESQVSVTLTRGFWLGRTEVTQDQWRRVMGTELWKGETYVRSGPSYPATNVSWSDAVEFCGALTKSESSGGRLPEGMVYQLPTEAQWEYGCRAGSQTAYSFGDDSSELGAYGWFVDNAWHVDEKYAHSVGTKRANPWGLYDMHGNVYEWCRDRYGEKLPGGRDPFVSAVSSIRVRRGGSWYDHAEYCRSAHRYMDTPVSRYSHMGFRVALVPVE